ncbi:hypothetical protein SKAU_G00342590 [Synaphobranchus kaupii]|uniref:Uncharacterized protein n=1 Tax=Synaphobranchus kaupii TaxID=118154 RepID=A0A9Q1EIV1_SYNKA|nr:hypothetical protein SKAU_G00342590 [Synaphobranchus kaupii]
MEAPLSVTDPRPARHHQHAGQRYAALSQIVTSKIKKKSPNLESSIAETSSMLWERRQDLHSEAAGS